MHDILLNQKLYGDKVMNKDVNLHEMEMKNKWSR